MALQASGTIKMSEINAELGRSSNATISLDSAESGTYGAINTNSPSYPNDARPAAMSEWYSYDHTGSSSLFFTLINSGSATSNDSCALTGPDSLTLYHGTGSGFSCPPIGRTVYTDAAQTTPFNGQSLYWQSPICGSTYLITSSGYIENVVVCAISGNISTDASPEGVEACTFSMTNLVYKSGSSATPSVGETLWQDSALVTPYMPAQGYNLWYAYQPSGSSTVYSLFLLDGGGTTFIESVSTC